MPMLQDDIRRHYEENWSKVNAAAEAAAGSAEQLRYSSPVEDAVLYPAYLKLIDDLKLIGPGAKLLDVGAGSGRWVRFFLEHRAPARLVGVDFAAASVELLRKWFPSALSTQLRFDVCDITTPELDLGERFDLINIANVLFHIPEPDRFARAVQNLAAHLAPGGRIVTTEYLPHASMRTEWMLVRSRYEFEQTVRRAGLRIVETRGFCFFSNDPMGIDGPADGTRQHFLKVRAMSQQLLAATSDAASKRFVTELLAEVERACVSYARDHVSEADLPSQKLVVLARA